MKRIKLRIHFWGEKILRRKCRKVREVNDDIRMILDEMYSLMRVSDGIGLAANQAGIDLRLIVIQIKDDIFKLVNPKIIKREGSIKIEEGCLSFPGVTLDINISNEFIDAMLPHERKPEFPATPQEAITIAFKGYETSLLFDEKEKQTLKKLMMAYHEEYIS